MNDDDNDLFYDYTDDNTDNNTTTTTTTTTTEKDINEKDIKCRLLQLNPLLIIDQILSFTSNRPDLSIVATTCTYLCDLLYSKHALNLWYCYYYIIIIMNIIIITLLGI